MRKVQKCQKQKLRLLLSVSAKEGLNLVWRVKFEAWERKLGIAIVEMALKRIWNKVWVEIGVRTHFEGVWETGVD